MDRRTGGEMGDFRAMEENLRATLGVFAQAKPEGTTCALEGIAVAHSTVDFAMFNAAVLTAPAETQEQLEARLRLASGYFAERGSPWSVWLCDSWLGRPLRVKAAAILARAGLRRIAELPGMQAEGVLPASRALPAVECRRVAGQETREDFNHIMSVAFGVPMDISRQIYVSERTWTGPLRGYVGYSGGKAVATTAVVCAAGVVGVYAVGTLPEHRRQGYAEAVMRFALEQAREDAGLVPTVLQSSDAGFRLYRKMGYQPLARYLVYAT